ELYVAEPDGSTVTKVNDPTVNPNSDVDDEPVWAPDSSRIAYRSNESTRTGGVFVLRTVQPNGNDNVIVNPQGIVGNSSVSAVSFSWAPDSTRIAYLANQDDTNKNELYTSAAATSLDNEKVNGILPIGGNVSQYGWAPNGSRIAYRADQNNDVPYELWTATPTGGSITQVSGNNATSVNSFAWAPDSSRIAYVADEDINDIFELYTVLPDGTGGVQVSTNVTNPGFNVIGIPSWSPDSSRIAYVADLDANEVFELYTSQAAVATNSIKVNGTLLGGNVLTGPVLGAAPAWSPDSTALAFVAQQNTTGIGVYVGKANGTGTVKVSGATNTAVLLGPYEEVWAHDGSRLAYMADQDTVNTLDLYTTIPTGNTNIVKITPTPVQNNSLKSFGKWAPDSSYIAYVSAQDTADVAELYMSKPTGGNNQNISGALVFEGDVDSQRFEWAP
ncbi:MAG: LpqB family beta-propeller domain-containing protein, partial [Gammaproteobacteria bacterium]|nr:LpqB family beta-propeller domain-containing protein [Gammaproteobacteria bacterium]